MSSNSNSNSNSNSLLANIIQELENLRDPKQEDSRRGTYYELLDLLGYKKKLHIWKYDAFLIKAVDQCFAVSTPDADIVLMALGLLDGYSYREISKHTDRRVKYLKETTYLGSKKVPYDKADDRKRESYEKTIREKSENPKLHKLAEYLGGIHGQVDKFLDDINDYIDGKMAILPTPSYIKRKPLGDRIKKAVINFFLLGKEIFTTERTIEINKDNKYEININLTKEAITILSNATICMLLCISIPITTTIYTQKYTIVETQETDMEYQTKNDITKAHERANQKLDAKPTAGLSSENDTPVSSF